MRRRLTTLLAKQGHNRDGHPRQLLDEAVYRERREGASDDSGGENHNFDGMYSGWSHASRPRGLAISLRGSFDE